MARHVFVALVFASVGLVASGVAAQKPKGPSVALLPLVASGLGADEIGPLDRQVQAVARGHFGHRLIAGQEVDQRLEQNGVKGVRCDRTDPACSAQLGAVCGVDQVLVASVAVTASGSAVAFRLIDVAQVAQLAHASAAGTSGVRDEELVAVLRSLDTPEARSTLVTVKGPAGGLLVVDGEDRGVLPMAPLTDLAPGPHEVGVDGPSSFRVNVDLRRGEPVVVEAPAAAATGPADATRAPASAPPSPGQAAASSAPVAEGLPMSTVVLASGGAAAVVGAVIAAVGMWPFLAASADIAELNRLDAASRNGRDDLEADPERVRALHESATGNEAAWAEWGFPTTIVGATLVGAGIVGAGVGLFLPQE